MRGNFQEVASFENELNSEHFRDITKLIPTERNARFSTNFVMSRKWSSLGEKNGRNPERRGE